VVQIQFGNVTSGALKYAPACIIVSQNTAVTFTGNFSLHPLRPGEVIGGVAIPQGSLILPTSTGTSATFFMEGKGTYPYYCLAHFTSDMFGAIFVQ
jgi:plastocyanin